MSLLNPLWRWVGQRVHLAENEMEELAEPAPEAPHSPPAEPALPARSQVEDLMQKAMSAPDAESLLHFLEFANRFRELAPFNMKMVYVQRPGSFAVARRHEWKNEGYRVRGDAIPIIILRAFGPIEYVYDEADLFPRPDREPANPWRHMSGVEGKFETKWLTKLRSEAGGLSKKTDKKKPTNVFRVHIEDVNYGGRLMGTASAVLPWFNGELEKLAHGQASVLAEREGRETRFRIRLNRDLSDAQKFRVLAHELGHIFCGHQGGFPHEGELRATVNGWPARRGLPHSVREIEAELVAWLVCSRRGMATGSPLYLKPHLQAAQDEGHLHKVSVDIVISALKRIEDMSR